MDTSDDAPPGRGARRRRASPSAPPAACAPEVECYLALVALTTLLRHATPVGAGEAPGPALADAKFVAEAIVARVRTGFPHRRSMDALSAKARRRARARAALVPALRLLPLPPLPIAAPPNRRCLRADLTPARARRARAPRLAARSISRARVAPPARARRRPQAFFYLALVYERCGGGAALRPLLLAAHRTACLRRDEMTQATLLNLLLRSLLDENLVEQAYKLVSKTAFPETVSNNQFCRYLYFTGRIQALQLDYTDAYTKLMQSQRKAPATTASGFRIAIHKLMVIVQLLMGEVPDRSVFAQPEYSRALRPPRAHARGAARLAARLQRAGRDARGHVPRRQDVHPPPTPALSSSGSATTSSRRACAS